MTILENIAPVPIMQFLDNSGAVVPGGLLFTYAAGTTTKLTTYTDATGGTPNANPIVADASGRLNCWIPTGSVYKFKWCPATDTDPPTNPFWTVDNISGFNPTSVLVKRFVGGVDYTGGTTLSLTLPVVPLAQANTMVYFDGVYQDKSQYSLSSATLSFTSAIPVATQAVEVIYTVNQVSTTYLVPSDIGVTVGYLNIPQSSLAAHYTTILSDQGKHLYHPASDNNPRTYTIADNSSVAYQIGTCITFVNMTNTVTVSTITDRLCLIGGITTGPRTLAAVGNATALKVDSTSWVMSGTNLS